MLALVLAVRFALELTLLAAFGWWGYTVAGGGAAGWALAAVCVAAVAVFWGLLLSPKARVRLQPGVRTAVEVALFLVAAVALATQGRVAWGIALVVADVLVLLALSGLGATTGGDPAGSLIRKSSSTFP